MLQTGAKGLQPCDLLGAHVEAPLVPVPTGYQMGGGGLLSRIFCTGRISGIKGPLKSVLMPIFLLVSAPCRLPVP
jgi:hypothetical protein